MILAVTYENGNVFQHFGHSKQFKLYEVEDNKVVSSKVIDTEGSGHGALADFLKTRNVEVLICGGIGQGAKNALAEANIQLFGGVVGVADDCVQDYVAGKLQYNADVACSHHDHNHENCASHDDHECGHHCGN